MFKRILVPLDGSPLAESALAPAILLAERFDAALLLVRAILVHVFPGADPGPAQLEALHEAERYLDAIAHPIRDKGILVHISIPYDSPAIGIADQAEFRHVDLIVMSTHGRKWPDTLLHPSVTMGVLEHTAAPILALKGAGETQDELPRFMTDPHGPILVPTDGSSLAESALPLAEALAKTFGNPLLLVRVTEQPHIASASMESPMMLNKVEEWAEEETRSYLLHKQQELAGRGLRAQTESATGSPVAFIEECIRAHHAGLVVMASHGRNGLGRFLLGSVAQRVLRESNVPVLLARFQKTPVEQVAAVLPNETSLN
jgi:nucleotide-binding universal stress UspA family protein